MFKKQKTKTRTAVKPSCGTFLNGDPVIIELPSPHIILAGTTGSGKSSWLNSIIKSWEQEPIEFYGVDLKAGLELSPWQHRFEDIATSTSDTAKLLVHLRGIIAERYALMFAKNLRMWDPVLGPWMCLIVDELAELGTLSPDLLVEALTSEPDDKTITQKIRRAKDTVYWTQQLLASIAQISRAAGVTIIVATQYPSAEIIGANLRSNITGRIMLKQNSLESYEMLFGKQHRHLHYQISLPGEAHIKNLAGCQQATKARNHLII